MSNTNSRIGVGVIGCGAISGIYFENLRKFDFLEIKACADLIPERANETARKYGILRAVSADEIFQDSDIDIVLNLTIPSAHYDISLKAIKSGKSVYSEKPITTSREECKQLIKEASAKNVLVGCAPDTFLGAGIQKCREIIDAGLIGEPVAVSAFMACHGHEGWHPSPEFYYKKGGGPLFDMGPYYLTALVALLGPVRTVSGMARITYPTRTITSKPLNGKIIDVEVPTHVAGLMEFENKAIATMIMSFDIWASTLPRIEIYGSLGTLSVPDPNTFGGPVKMKLAGEKECREVPFDRPYSINSRGLGVADMAMALRSGKNPRASGMLASHVLDIMHAFYDSSNKNCAIHLSSTCSKPAPVPAGIKDGEIT